jgi:hypothetical protein
MKFTNEYIDHLNVKEIWTYDTDIVGRPIKVEFVYPKNYKHPDEILAQDERNLPMSKRTFLNPISGKFVSYNRYMQLKKEGII